jgi:SAM-dependent methyltransferase
MERVWHNITKSSAAWVQEYKKQGIPSSFRNSPSRPVTIFISWLEKERCKGKNAADLGCGRGRNSLYLASRGFSVTAIDLLQENIDVVNEQAKLMQLPVRAFAQDVSEKWPIDSGFLDVAIDVFCYKHITDKQAQKDYRKELWRSLKTGGYYFISLASVNDGFYGPLLTNSPCPEEKLIIDPYSNISSYLYSIEDLTEEFSDGFSIVRVEEQTSSGPMHGKEYKRKVLNIILKKKENIV